MIVTQICLWLKAFKQYAFRFDTDIDRQTRLKGGLSKTACVHANLRCQLCCINTQTAHVQTQSLKDLLTWPHLEVMVPPASPGCHFWLYLDYIMIRLLGMLETIPFSKQHDQCLTYALMAFHPRSMDATKRTKPFQALKDMDHEQLCPPVISTFCHVFS